MPRYFAFLRAINVGGHTVTNDELKKLFARAGIAGAETFIASGNVTFESKGKEAQLTKKLEAQFAKSLGYEVRTYLRTAEELVAIAEQTPFKPARHKSAVAFVVGFLETAATAAQRKIIAGFNDGESEFHVEGREVYWLCQTNQSNSKFSKVPFERRIGAAATWRNMNTCRRLVEKFVGGD